MRSSSPSTLKANLKEHLKLKEVKKLYASIEKHNLRAEAYKRLLQFYIKLKKN